MFNVMIQHDGTVRIEGGSCSVRSTKSNLNDNNWHHVAVTYNPEDGDKLQDLKIYVDGELDTNQSDSEDSYRSEIVSVYTDNTINDVRIGSTQYANYFWVGELDDIRIYSSCLNAAQIKDIYQLTTTLGEQKHLQTVHFINGKSKIKINLLAHKNSLLHTI